MSWGWGGGCWSDAAGERSITFHQLTGWTFKNVQTEACLVYFNITPQPSDCCISLHVGGHFSHHFSPSFLTSQVSHGLIANDVQLRTWTQFSTPRRQTKMEESQPTSFHIRYFNQSVMTRRCNLKCLVGNVRAGWWCGVSRSRDSCFWWIKSTSELWERAGRDAGRTGEQPLHGWQHHTQKTGPSNKKRKYLKQLLQFPVEGEKKPDVIQRTESAKAHLYHRSLKICCLPDLISPKCLLWGWRRFNNSKWGNNVNLFYCFLLKESKNIQSQHQSSLFGANV